MKDGLGQFVIIGKQLLKLRNRGFKRRYRRMGNERKEKGETKREKKQGQRERRGQPLEGTERLARFGWKGKERVESKARLKSPR
jgi:hypothetical protein